MEDPVNLLTSRDTGVDSAIQRVSGGEVSDARTQVCFSHLRSRQSSLWPRTPSKRCPSNSYTFFDGTPGSVVLCALLRAVAYAAAEGGGGEGTPIGGEK